ncbi:Insertion element IS1 2/3 protein insB (fragment) [Xenorhabdus bovienii str. feltiae Moldova]
MRFDGVIVSFQHCGLYDRWLERVKTLAGKLHVVSKRYTQRIERHNLNLRHHLVRLTRKTLSFSKSVEIMGWMPHSSGISVPKWKCIKTAI